MPEHLKSTNSPKESQSGSLGGTVHGGAQGERSDLPCLYSNISIENTENSSEAKHATEQILALAGVLTPYHRKVAQTLYANVEKLILEAISINHVAMFTLTYSDHVTDHKEAQRRFNSFNANYLKKHPQYFHWIAVKERQTNGRIHLHLVVQLKVDVGSEFDWEEYGKWLEDYKSGKRRRLKTGNASLRQLWKDNTEAAEKYGLGRLELLPVRSNAQALGRYVGKYISKHIGQREQRDKGARLVNYSQGWVKNSAKFSWNTDNAKEWRRKTALFAKLSHCEDTRDLSKKWGPNWAYTCLDMILNIDTLHQQLLEEVQQKVPF